MDDLRPVRPANFRWIEEGRLAGSARPAQAEHIAWLVREGVRAVVSATPMAADAEEAARHFGLALLALSVNDFGVPTEAQIQRFLDFTNEHLSRGNPVLVHCAAGIGRTGTLCSLWLVERGLSPEEALARVGVETAAQVALLRRWADVRRASD